MLKKLKVLFFLFLGLCLLSIFTLSSQQIQNQSLNENSETINETKEKIEAEKGSEYSNDLIFESLRERHLELAKIAARKPNPEAVDVIELTNKAINFISTPHEKKEEKNEQALTTINEAIQKIEGLMLSDPKELMQLVESHVFLIDSAPRDLKLIKEINKNIELSVKNKQYPKSRLLLNNLRSEIIIMYFYLPLTPYLELLKHAKTLLSNGIPLSALIDLKSTLQILVTKNKVDPLPLEYAIKLIFLAKYKYEDKDYDFALKFIKEAKEEVERAWELGYMENEKEYTDLTNSFKKLEENIKNHSANMLEFYEMFEKIKTIRDYYLFKLD